MQLRIGFGNTQVRILRRICILSSMSYRGSVSPPPGGADRNAHMRDTIRYIALCRPHPGARIETT